jgi:hypothetical protein
MSKIDYWVAFVISVCLLFYLTGIFYCVFSWAPTREQIYYSLRNIPQPKLWPGTQTQENISFHELERMAHTIDKTKYNYQYPINNASLATIYSIFGPNSTIVTSYPHSGHSKIESS